MTYKLILFIHRLLCRFLSLFFFLILRYNKFVSLEVLQRVIDRFLYFWFLSFSVLGDFLACKNSFRFITVYKKKVIVLTCW